MELPTPKDYELRVFVPELRVERRDGEAPRIRGHAAVFDKLSENLGGFREKIAPGAFADTIKADDVRALFNHSPDFVIGRNRAGTLRMTEDDRGLAVDIDPPDTAFARDLMISMERGDINQMSFGFVTQRDEWDQSDPKAIVRTLQQVRLFDVSVVTYPAYPQTDAAVRELRALQASGDEDAARAARVAHAMRRRRLALGIA